MDKYTVKILIILLFICSPARAITPVAHTDVVPYQRINYGETFNFGVVAFSKPGINRVVFAISGSGYSGGNKTVYNMELNTRVASEGYSSEGITNSPGWPGVWEYFCQISSNEFTSNGSFTVTPTVYDNNGNTRNLGATTLYVEAVSADYGRKECWVDGNLTSDSGVVGSSSNPYRYIQSAVSACQAANGGTSSGNIIYLKNYNYYDITGLTFNTTGEWLTITKDITASRNNTKIINGPPYSSKLRIDNVTLQAPGAAQEILIGNQYTFWTSNTRQIGAGRTLERSSPVMMALYKTTHTGHYYSTGDYLTEVNFGYMGNDLVRGAVIYKSQNDFFQNPRCLINVRVDNLTNGPSTVHCDGVQYFVADSDYYSIVNRLVYNYFGTDMHYQAIMINTATGHDNAFVNVFMEMRNPGESGGDTCPQLSSGLLETAMDHLLVWNCSFPYAESRWYRNCTNSSWYGNLFWQEISTGSIPSSTEWLYNHFQHVYGITPSSTCVPTNKDICQGYPCPHWYASIVDTGSNTATYGVPAVDVSTPGASDFGYPVSGSDLVDRLPGSWLSKVSADAFGKQRDSNPDIGALEYGTGGTGTDTTAPTITYAYISNDGKDLVLTADEPLVYTTGSPNSFTLSGFDEGAVTATYDSGYGTTTLTFSLSRTIYNQNIDGDGLLAHTAPGGGWQDSSGNELATFSGTTIVNGSTQTPELATLDTIDISTNGNISTYGFSENIQIGTGGAGGMALTLSGGIVSQSGCAVDGATMTCNNGRTVAVGETLSSFTYTNPGDGLEAVDDGFDVANITSFSGTFTNGVGGYVDPTVTITSPTDNGATTETTVNVSGTATVDASLYISSVTVNGVSATSSNNFATWTAVNVPISPGINTITATIVDSGAQQDTDSITYTRNQTPGIPEMFMGIDSKTKGIIVGGQGLN